MPTVKKCYHCKVIQNLTDTKLMALQQEYDKLQHYLQTKQDLGLYSANKQQADRFYKVGTRKIQGLFQCQTCGEDNADRNAAYNIAKRGLGQASNLGVTVDMPRTFPSVDGNTMMRKEASVFQRR